MENAMEGGIVNSLHEFILKTYPKARQGVLRMDDRLIEKGIIDSLGLLTLIGFLEGTFDIKVLDSDVTEDKFASIETLSAFVRESQSRKGVEVPEKVGTPQSSRYDEVRAYEKM